ncbi:MAG: hypothetical protein H0T76_18220 [Nannocystis sp.]|nr:hypothetical protein [Nannocystis sp.]MBA3548422.1 hypothetical protein [Nannocystis sp.]
MSSGQHLRLAVPADLDAIAEIKLHLRMRADPEDTSQSSRGGFLLGTSRDQYARLIAGGHTWVLGDDERVAGFAAALPDAELRASELWQRRGQLGLGEDLRALEDLPLGYLDQLAVLPDPKYRIGGVALAYQAVASLFAAGCAFVVTTVVDKPVRNLASRPLLAAIGALRLGSIDEHYADVGAITSDVFMVSRAALDPELQTDERVQAQLRRLQALASKLKGPGRD